MANEAASLAVKITSEISGLIRGTNESGKALHKLGGQARTGATEFAKYGAAAALAGAAVAAALVNNARQAIDSQAKLAKQLRTTTDSLATLDRAGQLSGVAMDKIATAGRTLDVALGKAAQGEKTYADALGALGLKASEVAALPLDQRIDTINQALSRNVAEAERAAVAADLFGSRNAAAIQQLKPDVLAEAARQSRLFGTALSDVDAAKVEMANDAISTMSVAFDGFIKQFTVELAPIIKAVGDEFLKTAEEAGGMGNMAQSAFNSLIDAAGFVMDAFEGVKRLFIVTADAAIIAFAGFFNFITAGVLAPMLAVEKLAEVFGLQLPAGAEAAIAAVKDTFNTTAGVVTEAKNHIDETLGAPLPSAGLKKFVADVTAAGEEAAKAATKAQQNISVGGGVASGLSEDQRKAMADKLDAIREANMTEVELERIKLADKLTVIQEALDAEQLTREEYNTLAEETRANHAAKIGDIEKQAADKQKQLQDQMNAARLNGVKTVLGQTSALMNSENRKMFEIGKAAAYSQALVNTYQGISQAWALGPILGPPMAALVALNGFAAVQNIRKQSFGGGGSASTAGGAAGGSNTQQINSNNQPVASGGGQGRNVYLTLQGVSPDSLVRAGTITDMLNKEIDDGAQLRGMGFAT